MATPPPPSGRRHPFGAKAFLVGMVGCALCLVAGGLLAVLGSGDLSSVGVAIVVLAAVCLVTVGLLEAGERAAARRRRGG